MSDYLAAQKAMSFAFDTTLEVVTKDQQKLALAGSGRAAVDRPTRDSPYALRRVADVEMLFDGKTLRPRRDQAPLYPVRCSRHNRPSDR